MRRAAEDVVRFCGKKRSNVRSHAIAANNKDDADWANASLPYRNLQNTRLCGKSFSS